MKISPSGRARRLIAVFVAIVLAGGSYLGFRMQYPAAKVKSICSGLLPVDSVLGLNNKSRLSLFGLHFRISGDRDAVGSDGLDATCWAGNVHMAIQASAAVSAPYENWNRNGDSMSDPLGAGWEGFIVEESDAIASSVLVNCTNWKSRQSKGILVAASVYEADDLSSARRKVAQLVTDTAREAAQYVGCEAEFGEKDIPSPPTGTSKAMSAGDATGTCSGLTSRPKVRETAAGASPVEECVLVGGLQLSAEYGPFTSSWRGQQKYGTHETASGVEDVAWTTASCGGVLGTAVYTAENPEDSDRKFSEEPLTKAERADLQHFAEQSAARHGCSAPVALGS